MQEEEKKEDPPLTDDRSHQNAQLNTSSTNESIVPAETSTDTQEPQTINYKTDTQNMEVHHHSHTHGKKGWKSYFWEFLMLFLAVFCGFLAEYQLEHVIEHQREKEYINSFIEDLKQDTAKLNQIVKDFNEKVQFVDLRRNLLPFILRVHDQAPVKSIYYCKFAFGERRNLFLQFRWKDNTTFVIDPAFKFSDQVCNRKHC